MRIDKFFSTLGLLSRKECQIALKRCQITIDGNIVKSPDTKIDENKNIITLDGKIIEYNKYVYIMLNKPQGYVSASTDRNQLTVIDLVDPQLKKLNLFPCGRLDKDTIGLVMLTNDGQSAHRLLSPKYHVSKTYKYECAEILTDEECVKLQEGIYLIDGYTTKPCQLEKIDNYNGYITLTEGKYHQIKRMFGALGNKITFLQRITFGDIKLDSNLKEGEWRYLTKEEQDIFTNIE